MMTAILIKEERTMKRIIILAVMATLALTACQREFNPEVNKPEAPAVFTATTESSATKTALSQNGENYDVLWQNGDQITIVDAAANVGVYQTASTTTQGSFSYISGTAVTTPDYKAWYPASLYDEDAPTLPATQEYTVGNIRKSPMYAESSTEDISFKNICGIIRLNVSTTMSDKKVRKIILSATQGMSGAISNASTLAGDSYVAAVSGTAGVTLDCGESGVAIGTEAVPFHIAVPANTYTGLNITITTTTGASQTFTLKSDRNVVVGRSELVTIDLSANNILYDLPGDYASAEYLESSGTQYIDTGVPCDWENFVDIDFMYTGDSPDSHDNVGGSVFGAHGWNKANSIYQECIYWRGYGKITYKFALNTRYNVKTVDATHTSIDGTSYQINNTSQAANASTHFALFANDSDYYNGWTFFSVARIYSCKLYDSHHVWLRYFVPCVRTSDGKPGMYDRVNDVFYVNQGTGEFYTDLTPSSVTDLSATATANTYIVSAPGNYKFNATVKGNGGLDPLTGTTAATIDPASIAGVKVLWELYGQGRAIKHDGSAYDISYSDGYVYFSTPNRFVPGDVCVAIYDSSDNILWSWVIWATPTPGTMTHNGKAFMDRNLGAIDVGNCMRGFLYDWGRKDAFSAANGGYDVYPYVPVASSVFTHSTGPLSMAYAVAHPTDYIIGPSSYYTWMENTECDAKPWRTDVKTIYDPCPAGWRIPTKEEISHIDGLPATGLTEGYDADDYYKGFGNPGTGYYWTSSTDEGSDQRAYAFCNDGRNLKHWGQDQGYAIRPVQE